MIMDAIRIIHEPSDAEPFVVLEKKEGLPSAPLEDGDDCALTRVMTLFPSLADVEGRKKVEHGLVHRLDTDTDGLLLIASTQAFYNHIILAQKEGLFIKKYSARCRRSRCSLEGFPPCPVDVSGLSSGDSFALSSGFRHFGARGSSVRPVTGECSEVIRKKAAPGLYETNVKIISEDDSFVLVDCTISRGFMHQVRCHLSWCGLCIVNDRIYNPIEASGPMEFHATGLQFPLENGKTVCFGKISR